MVVSIASLSSISGCSSGGGCSRAFSPSASTPSSPNPDNPRHIRKEVSVEVVYPDGSAISGVEISCDNAAVKIVSAVTDEQGRYSFYIDMPDGTSFTLNFHKDGYVIASVPVTIGENGITEADGTILYQVATVGYVPLNNDGTQGKITDFFAENIGIYNGPMDIVTSPDWQKMYIADSFNHRIRVLNTSTGELSTLAGSAISGYREGAGSEARFWEPLGMAVTADGKTLYVSDQVNSCIRKVDTATGQVSLVAGTPGISGLQNGGNYNAKFNQTGMIALSTDESALYVADSQNKVIRKIDLTGANGVTTVGSAFSNSVYGVTVVNNGTKDMLYVAATFEHKIYSMDPANGAKTFIAGSTQGYLDGAGNTARFYVPVGIRSSHSGRYLYVSDNSNNVIRKINLANNYVSTLSGSMPGGYSEGTASMSKFLAPAGLIISNDDQSLYIADTSNNRIRKVDTASGESSKFSGGGRAGFQDGANGSSSVAFNGNVHDVAVTADCKTLYVSDIKSIWKVDLETKKAVEIAPVSYIGTAFTYNLSYGYSNRATSHKIILSHDEKTIYLADSTSNMIRSIDIQSGNSLIIAGNTAAGFADAAIGANARFNQPNGLALSAGGDALFVSDGNNHRIRKVVISSGATTTIAGSSAGFADGPSAAARFNLPTDVAVSPDYTSLYVADSYNHRIRKIALENNQVSTVAGNSSAGLEDGTGSSAVFDEPRGLALTADGTVLFVTDCRGGNIRKIDLATAKVTTYAGGTHIGYADGTAADALFYNPDGIAVTSDSKEIFIADEWNSMIRKAVAVFVTTY